MSSLESSTKWEAEKIQIEPVDGERKLEGQEFPTHREDCREAGVVQEQRLDSEAAETMSRAAKRTAEENRLHFDDLKEMRRNEKPMAELREQNEILLAHWRVQQTEIIQAGEAKYTEGWEYTAERNYNRMQVREDAESQAMSLEYTQLKEAESRMKEAIATLEGDNYQIAERLGIPPELRQTALEQVPPERQREVFERLREAPPEIRALLEEQRESLKVEDAKPGECCHYNLGDKTIRMEKWMPDDEYAEVFSHEYGHFADNQLDWPSRRAQFQKAFAADTARCELSSDAGRERTQRMMDDLFRSDAAYDRAVSDICSATFLNAPEVRQRFDDEAVSYYRHDNAYWAVNGNRESEVYANLFSIYASDTASSRAFVQRWFPETVQQFRESLRKEENLS